MRHCSFEGGKQKRKMSVLFAILQIFGDVLNEMLTTPILALNCFKKILLSHQIVIFKGKPIDLL